MAKTVKKTSSRKSNGKSSNGFLIALSTMRMVRVLAFLAIAVILSISVFQVLDFMKSPFDFLQDFTDQIFDNTQAKRDRSPYEDPAVQRRTQYYTVDLKTSRVKGAGTDGKVSLKLHGEKGESPNWITLDDHLDTPTNNLWEGGSEESIIIHTNNVGYLTGISLKQEGGPLSDIFGNDAWFPESVTVSVDPERYPGYAFEFNIPPGTKLEGSSGRFAPTSLPPKPQVPIIWIILGAAGLVAIIVMTIRLMRKGKKTARRTPQRKSRAR